VSQRLMSRASIQSSGLIRTAGRVAASCLAKVVLPLPGNPHTITSRPRCLVARWSDSDGFTPVSCQRRGFGNHYPRPPARGDA
jgi:hypothetical protein